MALMPHVSLEVQPFSRIVGVCHLVVALLAVPRPQPVQDVPVRA